MEKKFRTVDLTHSISHDVPTWDSDHAFELLTTVDYKDCTPPNLFRGQKMKFDPSVGTHMDAPAHCVPGGRTIEGLGLQELVTDCAVIRVDGEADESYVITPSIVERFEKEHGKIAPNTFVIFHTGWDRFWGMPEKYVNSHRHPSVHVSTAEMLLSRDIAGIGIDTLSPDRGAEDFPIHRAILGAGKYIVENVANSKELSPTGAKILVLPMKIKDATEAPVRLIALL